METINIFQVRQAENDYAAISDIVSKMQDYIYNQSTLHDKELKAFVEALTNIEYIKNRVFMEAKQTARKFLRTA